MHDSVACLLALENSDEEKTLMAYGLWPMAYGLWPMAYGLWPMAYGLWNDILYQMYQTTGQVCVVPVVQRLSLRLVSFYWSLS